MKKKRRQDQKSIKLIFNLLKATAFFLFLQYPHATPHPALPVQVEGLYSFFS
jgi:hypothetical protein